MWREISIQTKARAELVDITAQIKEAAADCGVHDGVCTVFVPHTTAGIVINESADPDVAADLLSALEMMVPDGPYKHGEGNSAAHVKSALLGSSVSIPLIGGRLALGTWQGVFFGEFDGPRRRRAVVVCAPG